MKKIITFVNAQTGVEFDREVDVRTRAEVRQQVALVQQAVDSADYEAAGGLERALFEDVLKAIAEDRCGGSLWGASSLARDALKTLDIKFDRGW